MLASSHPYSLTPPAFRFRALAALAGRAALGGERETALAVLLAARLAAAVLPAEALSLESRVERARAARNWLSALTLPAGVRPALARVIDASAGESIPGVAAALERAVEAVAKQLDAGSAGELVGLVKALKS